MEPSHDASGQGAGNEPHTVIRVVRRWRVVKRQERASQQLNAEESQQHAAECEEPAGAGWQRLIEQDMPRTAKPGPRLQPVEHASHRRTRTLLPAASIRASI